MDTKLHHIKRKDSTKLVKSIFNDIATKTGLKILKTLEQKLIPYFSDYKTHFFPRKM